MQLLLMRHWEPLLPSGPKRYIGQTDYPLSPAGLKQAGNGGTCISHTYGNISHIYSSPLLRCASGAKILSGQLDCPLTFLDELKEIHLGVWETLPFEEVKKNFPLAYEARGKHMDTFVIPGGESFVQVQRRALTAVRNIIAAERPAAPDRDTWGHNARNMDTVLLITHAGVIRTLLCYLDSCPLSELFRYQVHYGEITSVESEDLLRQDISPRL